MVKSVVLAGGSPGKADVSSGAVSLADKHKDNKAFMSIGGRPMVQYILSVLLESDKIDEVIVVGPKQNLESLTAHSDVKFVEETDTVLDNLITGVYELSCFNENILVVTSDIPLITIEAVDNFLEQCHDEYDLIYPVISRQDCEHKFPGTERTYVNLFEGEFTGGNVFYINPHKISPCYEIVNKLICQRKNPVRLAMNFGLGFLLRFLCGQMKLEQAEDKISEILKINARVVVSSYPELGIDIDKPADFKLAEKIISEAEVYT